VSGLSTLAARATGVVRFGRLDDIKGWRFGRVRRVLGKRCHLFDKIGHLVVKRGVLLDEHGHLGANLGILGAKLGVFVLKVCDVPTGRQAG